MNLKVVCSWCGVHIRGPEEETDFRKISHGICGLCLDAYSLSCEECRHAVWLGNILRCFHPSMTDSDGNPWCRDIRVVGSRISLFPPEWCPKRAEEQRRREAMENAGKRGS